MSDYELDLQKQIDELEKEIESDGRQRELWKRKSNRRQLSDWESLQIKLGVLRCLHNFEKSED